MKKSILTITAAVLTVIPAVGQTQQSLEPGWTLRQCIDYARENNIQVQQAQTFPALSASTAQTVSFSKIEDMNGEMNLKGAYNGNYGVSAPWTLYNGGRLRNSYELQKIYNDAYEINSAVLPLFQQCTDIDILSLRKLRRDRRIMGFLFQNYHSKSSSERFSVEEVPVTLDMTGTVPSTAKT